MSDVSNPRVRNVVASLAAAVGLLIAGSTWAAVNTTQLKAAFLYHLPQFVEWPDDSMNPQYLTLCISGTDPYGEVLDFFEGKGVKGRTLKIRRLKSGEAHDDCSMLFVSSEESKNTPALMRKLAGSPVLTIGEADNFTRQGGVIRLISRGGQVELEINLDAAEAAHLSISAKLLSLAQIVRHPAAKADD